MSATPTASRSNSLVPPPLALRSPLGAVTNVSQRLAELDKGPEKVQDNEDEVFSQDDQLDQTKVTSQQHEPVNPKTKKGKNKQVSKAESSSGASEKLVELSVTLTRPNLKPVPGAKEKSSKPSHADTMVRCVKETKYTTFQSSILAAAIKAGLSATGYTDLDVEGKISAGGVWKNKQRLHDETAFQSFWDKILKKKTWEAYVFVAQSPMAVIELSSDSGVKTEEDSEDENSIEKQLLGASTADTKKRKSDESQSNTAASTSNKRAKVVVKDEAEEARKKSAGDILRRHACSKHGAKACFQRSAW
ncbi:unnamed protein product, partial [Tilletia controversa]